MDKQTESVVRHLAQRNLRGITSSDIVCEIQFLRQELSEEKNTEQQFYLTSRFNHLLNELERRSRLNESGVRVTNREIIQTLKDRVPIDTVLSWYTDVFTHKSQWTFRCTLHGADKDPSGVIYRDENRFHCFACGAHGDIFEAVRLFNRMELHDAINLLGKYIGLETDPIQMKPTNIDERLRQVELKTEHLLRNTVGKKGISKYD